ncbi:hypothetical protein SERLA73DRAFT_91290 [Serpula lacrymans var. lacrymans S7.3]|uniref:Protein kinase domain-containing protein n=2 Tax=Serpula lacrymans var. lacrymans TaxID=341189 RepID=F8Q198_SERL3|nr:uncharacterized protein SERLADRAFT_416051 [Serpula lacrymans var. lacrymans S7.9]EGN98076.1 hypothetical protein SERLA73DRAFT_91290 [Serpula lacrymans var. lacrymans S7.3]EGO23662.1 hypothetical protein SERLADRAFT_416051 [Serpula lacrymans var. lacrymans S7.9]
MALSIPRRINNYWLEDCLGSGYSGSIFRACHIYTGQRVAIKLQNVDHECPTNRYERAFYPMLQGGEGMPTLWAAGVEGIWDFLVIDLLGPSLDSLFRKSGKNKMDLRSVCSIAIQLISRLQIMHTRGVLHRDIQLGNCAIGLSANNKTIYMIDFGFSKQYIDPHTRRHIPDSKAKRDFLGNYWFTSVGVHCKGKVPSRRDDLEAAALMLIHLLTPGGLSWTRNGVPKTDAQHDRIKRDKLTARPEDLCRGIPAEFEEFLRYCRRLKFADCPDYDHWKDEFKELANEHGFSDIDDFVWPPPPPKVKSQITALHQPKPGPAPYNNAPNMEEVLNGLAKLNLKERPVLGDQTNTLVALRKEYGALQKPVKTAVIEISSDSDDSADHPTNIPPPPNRFSKATQLHNLAASAHKATDNRTLSMIVTDFVACLQSTRSRMLTKEGFQFLDTLYKQLADPSVFAVPLRTSRTRSTNQDVFQPPARHVKLGALITLRREVTTAPNNRALAKMVADFGTVTNKSSGRTITKDGIAFLEGLAERLKALN